MSTRGEEMTEEIMEDGLSNLHFSVVDYAMFTLMLVASVAIGIYSAFVSRGKESTQEYLLGSRSMSPYPVALSLLGGVVSSISVLGNATEVYMFGTQLCVVLLGIIPGCILVNKLILPIFYNLNLVSIHQYIELRFGSPGLRKMMTLCLTIKLFFIMGICLYAPSLALAAVTGLSTWASMLIMGAICTFYITIGGVKAVVYTDVLQTFLMFTGVLLVVIICCVDIGGMDKVWQIAQQGDRIQFFNFDPSPFVRHTFWSTFMFGIYLMIHIVGLNQPCYQRFASVSSLITAQRLCWSFMVGLCFLWGLLYFSGLVAYAVYHSCDPLTSGRIEKPDQIIPFLVMDKLSYLKGVPGIFVAAVYGAVLSTVSTCANAIACMIWEDFLRTLPYFADMTNRSATNILKLISAMTGVLAIFMGVLAGQLGNIFHVTYSISGAFLAPMQGVYLAGMCTPWVESKGAVVGFLSAFVYNMWVVIGKFIRGGGSPNNLPLSTQDCPFNLTTALTTTDINLINIPTTAITPSLTPETDIDDGTTVYDVSYCYFGLTGICITIIVSSITSFIIGVQPPKAMDRRLISGACARFYCWAWGVIKGHDDTKDNSLHIVTPVDTHLYTPTDALLIETTNSNSNSNSAPFNKQNLYTPTDALLIETPNSNSNSAPSNIQNLYTPTDTLLIETPNSNSNSNSAPFNKHIDESL